MPDPIIKKPNQHFDATLWTGDGGTQTVTNAGGFQPDLVWVKSRTDTGSHSIQDSVRGVGSATKLCSNSTNAENNAAADATDPIYGYLTAINSNGFTAYAGTTPSQVNKSAQTYVGWQWKAGGASTVNTSGTISSNVSVNATAGFSVVTWTGNGTIGATVGHGLGVAPSMIIVKQRSGTESWATYHISLGATKYLNLNQDIAAATSITRWNNTTPSSTVITFYNDDVTNRSGGTYVAYCWAEIAGFSKFGSYTGNGSTDGPFVYLGFRPKFIMWKETATSSFSWNTYDSVRNTYNIVSLRLNPNASNAEFDASANFPFDFLSNGFKIRGTNGNANANGNLYIYMAFAESPFKFSNAR
jgi:hypothetical protein